MRTAKFSLLQSQRISGTELQFSIQAFANTNEEVECGLAPWLLYALALRTVSTSINILNQVIVSFMTIICLI